MKTKKLKKRKKHGKKIKKLPILNLDGLSVNISSTRSGVIQIGEGRFMRSMLINSNPLAVSNTLLRLTTLMHEGRHSDGNGVNAGFYHDYCPPGHNLVLTRSCERVSNGPYTIAGTFLRQMIQSCKTCSVSEKTALQTRVADTFNRVLKVDDVARMNQLRVQIASLQNVVNGYKSKNNTTYEPEIRRLEAQINRLKLNLNQDMKSKQGPLVNPAPEGQWTPLQLKDTQAAMEASLRKR